MRSLDGFPVSPQQIRDTVNHVSGVSRIAPRYQLLDRTLTPVGIPGGAGLDQSDLSAFVMSGSIANDTNPSTAVARSLTITWKEVPGLQINSLNHHITVWQDWYDQDGEVLFSVPRGVFALVLPDVDLASAGITWTVQCLDTISWLNTTTLENTYTVASGTNYIAAAIALLRLDPVSGTTPAGLPCPGPGLPLARIAIPPSPLVSPTDIPFARGTTFLTAVNTLLVAACDWPLFADEDGVAMTALQPFYATSQPATAWAYATGNQSVINGPVQQRWPDQAKLGNVQPVISENQGLPTLSSVKENHNPQSALSIENLGRRIVLPPIQDNLIPDQATCDQRATLELQRVSMAVEQVSMTVTPNPFIGSHDYLKIDVAAADGTAKITTPPTAPFHLDAFTEDLNARTMTLTASRAVVI